MTPDLARAVRLGKVVLPPSSRIMPVRISVQVAAREPWTTPEVVEIKPKLRALLAIVARAHGGAVADMRGRSRRQPIVRARSEFFWRAAAGSVSYRQAALFLGRDHTAAMYGIGRHCLRTGLPMPRYGVDLAKRVERCVARAKEWHRNRRKGR